MSSARRIVAGSIGLLACATLLFQSIAQAQEPAPARTLTESQVVSTAVRQSPGLRASVLEYQRAGWLVTSEEARYAPIFEADGTLSRTASPRLTATGTDVSPSWGVDAGAQISKHYYTGTDVAVRVGGSWTRSESNQTFGTGSNGTLGPAYGLNARLSVTQPLLRGAGTEVGEAELRTARLRRTTSELTRDRAGSELLKGVLNAYWELWYADTSLAIQQQSRGLSVEQRDQAAARAATGSLAPADVLTFDTQVASRDEDVLTAELERTRRQLELALQLGASPRQGATGLPSEVMPPVPPMPPADAEELALRESPQIREQQAAIELARLQARTADDARRARLDLGAWVQTEGLGNNDAAAALGQAGRMGAVSAQVGLTYEESLDNSARRADKTRALLAIQVAEQNLQETQQSITSDVRVALARDAAGRRKLELAEQTSVIAKKQLEAEKARFQTGASTPIAVLQAEDQARNAELRVARARADLLENNLTIQHLTGRLVARYAMLAKSAGDQDAGPTAATARPMIGAF